MRYSEAIYIKAEAELSKRKKNAELLAKMHKNEVEEKYPVFAQIDEEIRNAALIAIKSVGSGKDTDILSVARKNLEAQERRKALLKKAGYPEDYLDPQYTCKICGDTGIFEGRLCECHLKLLKSIANENLSCSSLLSSCTFGNFDLSFYSDKIDSFYDFSPKASAKAYCVKLKEFAENFPKQKTNFLLRGGTGLGKTHLALSVMNRLNERNFNVFYGSMSSVIKDIEKEHFGKSDNGTEDEIYDSDCIILDDLGTEFDTAFSKTAVFEIINNAILSGKPMIICTNMTLDELKDRYGDRIVSRLNSFEVYNFIGADIRQIKK